ncbi:MAG: dihydroorotase [Candidatus Omnitrophota bacterium]|nr:dihydroorotase [Candidatus Omnitrophota bacterium]
MKLLIKNGLVIDPSQNLNAMQDILVNHSKIIKVAKNIQEKVDKTIDATSKIIMPGIVDMHVHLREPGREDKETIESATQAALKGGVTSVLAMPNTEPTIDSLGSVKLLKAIIKNTAKANVFIAGAITLGRLGKELSDIASLKKEGTVAITDDGFSVDDQELFLKALKKAKQEKVLVICHCEDKTLSQKGAVNLGFVSTILGLRGISKVSEYKRVKRDIHLAKQTNATLHIAHVSCQESVEIIASAKKNGINVTAETAPHYFSLTEEAVLGYDTNMKVNPPLRTKEDVIAIRQGLKNGIIDVIASDHAPHTENEKNIEFDCAEFGTIGLETQLAVGITELINSGLLDWPDLVKKLALNPARILGIDRGTLQEGSIADIIIVDPHKEWLVKKEDFVSKSKNSCFMGRRLQGAVEYTILEGNIVYENI